MHRRGICAQYQAARALCINPAIKSRRKSSLSLSPSSLLSRSAWLFHQHRRMGISVHAMAAARRNLRYSNREIPHARRDCSVEFARSRLSLPPQLAARSLAQSIRILIGLNFPNISANLGELGYPFVMGRVRGLLRLPPGNEGR